MGFRKAAADALKPIFRPSGNTIEGINPGDWNSPNNPIRPVLPPGTGVRSWDFQSGLNQNFTPRGDSPVSFHQLRSVANSFDLCRLMIETRKDQVVNRPWVVRVKPLPGEDNKTRSAREAKNGNIAKVNKLLKKPDGVHAFPLWIRMWLDQLLTFDAPCIYPERNVLGDPLRLRLISGATITPLVDEFGFVPAPPSPAYQQILQGIPSVNLAASKAQGRDFTSDQLIYSPRNPRVDSRWGYSPVEQIITTLGIAANRQTFLKNYYTEGNIPEGILPMPKEYSPQQIKDFQNWFDSLMVGNMAKRRRLTAIPSAEQPVQFAKAEALTDVTDEYLIRVVAFAFSITPQNLIKQVNRGTAKESSDVAQIEGLEPVLKHIETVINLDVIESFCGIDDVEFAYLDEQEMDPLKQAQVDNIYVGKVQTVNETRALRGMDARPEPEADMLGTFTATGFVPLGQQAQVEGGDQDSEGNDGRPVGKGVKKNSEIRIVGGKLTAVAGEQARKAETLIAGFLAHAGKVVAQKSAGVLKVRKDDETEEERINRFLEEIELEWALLGENLSPMMIAAAMSGVDEGRQQVANLGPASGYLGGAKSHAHDFAADRAAELVGMKRQADGTYVPNPDARWNIDATTREGIRDTVKQGFENAWTPSELAEALESSYTFSAERAGLIAKTEIARAQAVGNVESWQKSGVVLKVAWQLSADHDESCCDICDAFAAQGEVEPGHEFAPGITAPGAHPRCECALVVRKVKQ